MSGVIWAIIAAVGFGLFQVVNRRAGREVDVYQATFILLLVSTVLLGITSLTSADLALLWPLPVQAIIYFGLAGLIHFLLGWTLLSASQNRVGAARTSALIGATPLFATVIAALTLNEFLTLPAIIGVILVVIGVYLVSSG